MALALLRNFGKDIAAFEALDSILLPIGEGNAELVIQV